MRLDWRDREFLEVVGDALEPTTERVAEELAEDMERHAPVSKYEKPGNKYGNRPGTLRDSIRVYKSKYRHGGHTVFIGGKGFWGDAFYWHFVVLGTHRSDPNPFPQQALSRINAVVPRILRKTRLRNPLSVRQRRKLKLL